MLPAMKITEPYSPTARAKASTKPVSTAGQSAGSSTRQKVMPARGAEAGGRLLDLLVDLLDDRLHGAHHEGQADEDQRDDDAERREGHLDAQRLKHAADPAVRRVERGERDARHGGRQREGQVDQCVDQALAGEAVAHQHPGDDQAEHGVDRAPRSAPRRSSAGSEASTRGCVVARTPPSVSDATGSREAGHDQGPDPPASSASGRAGSEARSG